ncbi:ABC transporter permease [Ruminococcus sp. Marseille-P6503]|uniref:ABC transporter permease n=1 Tax=Ruminococcus sp. Marseille-P6503 TaxID=2364796 RepID=UPI000F51C161|nr:ABC transporter permease [Ruminococcus sp. Marseille-P6503]
MLAIIKKEVMELFRSVDQLFFVILFPSLMVFLLGTLLEDLDVSDYDIGEIKLGYCSQGQQDAAEQYFQELEAKGVISLEYFDSADEAVEQIKAERLTACAESENGKITLYLGNEGIKNRSLTAMTQGFLYMNQTYTACAANMEDPMRLTAIQPEEQDYTKTGELGIERSMIDYYAVAMTVMIMFMGSLSGGGETFFGEVRNKTINKLYLSPLSRTKIFLAKVIGSLPIVVIEIAVIMIVSTVFFNAHYAADAADNLLLFAMLLSAALALLSVGIFVGLLLKKVSPNGLFQLISWIMLFFSGSFSKEIYIEGFSNYLPPYLLQQAAFELTLFGNKAAALQVIAASAVILTVFVIFGAVKFNRKEAV